MENKLPECPDHVAHPQAVWFNEHWRPVIEQLKADLKKITDENYEIRCQRQSWMNKIDEANYTENSALLQLKEMKIEIQQLKSKIEYANDEIHTLKNKLLVFEGMTFSENQEIAALKSKLKLAVGALEFYASLSDRLSVEYAYKDNTFCYNVVSDERIQTLARQTISEIGDTE